MGDNENLLDIPDRQSQSLRMPPHRAREQYRRQNREFSRRGDNVYS